MNNKDKKSNIKALIQYGVFGVAVVFTVTILVYWINHDIVQPIPMAILIGILLMVAYKLFRDALNREQKIP